MSLWISFPDLHGFCFLSFLLNSRHLFGFYTGMVLCICPSVCTYLISAHVPYSPMNGWDNIWITYASYIDSGFWHPENWNSIQGVSCKYYSSSRVDNFFCHPTYWKVLFTLSYQRLKLYILYSRISLSILLLFVVIFHQG